MAKKKSSSSSKTDRDTKSYRNKLHKAIGGGYIGNRVHGNLDTLKKRAAIRIGDSLLPKAHKALSRAKKARKSTKKK